MPKKGTKAAPAEGAPAPAPAADAPAEEGAKKGRGRPSKPKN